MEIKDRIIEFLKTENISSANFAQEIGVQPSGISHIFSGRNKPSLDFIVKMLNRYPTLSTEWLLFGKGNMLKDNIPGDLFSTEIISKNVDTGNNGLLEVSGKSESSSINAKMPGTRKADPPSSEHAPDERKASRIVIFYQDNTFREYHPD
jgi:transcriptional regulator with XRE-family HTH domain